MSNDVATTRRFSDDELRAIRTTADVRDLAQAKGETIRDLGEVIGTGFEVLKDKHELIGRPFVILDWRYSNGNAGEFVSVLLVTKEGRKLVLNDGSTGIAEQLRQVTPGVYGVTNGLRVSEYTVQVPNRKTGEMEDSLAETFYLAV